MMALAQPNVLSQKFKSYKALWPQPSLHVLFNQQKFAPGDTAWFKAYFLTEDLQGVPGRQLIEVNLVDAKGEARVHFLFAVTNGLGHSQLVLPETLLPGIYMVTAHSSWMKNFDPDRIYKKRLEIVQNNTLTAAEDLPRVGVEGGHLIANIESRVSVYHRIGSTVQIINEAGAELGRATTNEQGVCSISFTPQPNTAYFVRSEGDTNTLPLPPTETDGYSLRLTFGVEGPPTIQIIPASLARTELVLMVTARGKIYSSALVPATGVQQVPHNLPEGVAHISLLTTAGELLASRDFYNPGARILANINLDKDQFLPREKVRVEVSLTDNGQPIEGEFAISVVNAGLFDARKQHTLADELFFPGLTENVNPDRSDSTWLSTLDNLLILFPEKLPWPEIIAANKKPRYPFTTVIEKKGQAYFPGTLTPVPDNTQIMFYLQKNFIMHQTFAMDSGRVSFALPDLYSPDEFFYIAQIRAGKEIQNLKIVWEENRMVLPVAPAAHETQEADPYAAFVTRLRLIDKSFSVSASDAVTVTPEVEDSNFEEEIMGADITVRVQDYALFPTMAELVKEVIPSLYHRKTKKREIVRVGLLPPMIETNDPVYIIDNIATSNTEFFLSLKPADILTIKILSDPRKLVPLGLMGQNGLVIVHTKSGSAREPLDDQAKMITGLNKSLTFKSNDYSAASDLHRPDFRSTIYWNPIVKTNANGNAIIEFYTSDDIGALRITIDGLTTVGRPFSAGQEITVNVSEKN
jgi:hypothetical protein